MRTFIRINPADTVAVALAPLKKGTVIQLDNLTVTLTEDIPQGHKFALTDIAEDSSIIKYGNSIGVAVTPVSAGSWIHTHNMKTGLGDLLTYTYDREVTPVTEKEERFFQGYRRKDGRAGVRNEVWIIPTVGCVNNVAQAIEKASQRFVTDNVEGVIAFTHPYGCSQMGDDQEHTRQILADLINHPNAGAVLVLGLGCENSNIDVLKNYIGKYDPERVRFLVSQESDDEIADGIEIVSELAKYASDKRYRIEDCGTDSGLFKAAAEKFGYKYGFSYDGCGESFKELKQKLKAGDTAIVYLPGHYGTIVDYNAKKDKYLLMDPHYLPKRGTSSFGDWVSQKDLEEGALTTQMFFYYKAN